MICKNCGGVIEESAKFCPFCGMSVSEEKPTSSPEQPAEKQNKETNMDSGLSMQEEKKEINRIRYRIGFKWMLLISFIAFFMPFCTVSCGEQVILSPNGYELTGNWGMTAEQMEMIEVTPGEAGNYIIVMVLLLMVLAFIIKSGKFAKTVQTGFAALCLLVFANDKDWENIRNMGCQVKLEYGYYLSFVSLLLAATAFLWSPTVIEKLENIFISHKAESIQSAEASRFRKRIDLGLSLIIIVVITAAVFTNYDSLKNWDTINTASKKAPDLQNNLPTDSDYVLQDEELIQETPSKAAKKETENQWDNSKEITDEQDSDLRDNKAVNLTNQYEGEWWDLNSQRCYMEIAAIGGNKLSIVISWSSGYADNSKWEMTGQVNGRNGRIIYNDCIQYDIHYSDYGDEQKTVHYTNGNGYFYLGNDGYLYWEDEVEYAGSGCYFEKDDGSTEIETINSESEYILPDSSSRYLSEADLIGMDKAALRLARNEIYARHGRIFQSEDLNDYFNSKSWYYGYLSAEEFDDSIFNIYEKANLDLIKTFEN